MITTTSQSNIDLYNYRKRGSTTYSVLYTQAKDSAALTTVGGLSANLQLGIPFIVTNDCVLDRLGLEITIAGTAGSKSRIGIYADNGNNSPGSLLLDAGLISNDSATLQLITVNQALPAGLYWLAFVMNSAASPTFRAIPLASSVSILGMPTTGGTNANTLIAPSFAYGVLPSTFTTFSGTDVYNSVLPAFFMRFSA